MYCSRCDNDVQNGKFCGVCGKPRYSSKESYEHWKKQYAEYSFAKLQDIVNHSSEYQEDSLHVAEEMIENKREEISVEVETAQQEQSNEILEWYYVQKGNRVGPVSEQKIIKLFSDSIIFPEDLVWKNGFESWVELRNSGIVLPKSDCPPPLEYSHISNMAIWIMIFVPIVSSFLQHLIASTFNIEFTEIWWIALVINVVCCTIDCSNVKRAGYPVDKIMKAFVFLVPLYIYKRMKLVKGKKWMYTIIWCVGLIVDICISDVFWVSLIGQSDSSMIQAVQDGTLYGYRTATVEDLLDNAFENCYWDTYVQGDRSVIVESSGVIDDNEYIIKWIVNMNGSFNYYAMEINGEKYNSDDFQTIMKVIEYDYIEKHQNY